MIAPYRDAFSAPEKEHYELGKKSWKIALEEVWAIGTVGHGGIRGDDRRVEMIGGQPGQDGRSWKGAR